MGEYFRNKRQGFAIEENLESKYEGTYINNCLSGKGILTFKDGMKYIGQIYKTKFDGFGKISCSNGDYFIGEFKNDEKYKGIAFYAQDRGLFDAIWESNKDNDEFIGKGIYYLPDGTKQNRARIIKGKEAFWQYF